MSYMLHAIFKGPMTDDPHSDGAPLRGSEWKTKALKIAAARRPYPREQSEPIQLLEENIKI